MGFKETFEEKKDWRDLQKRAGKLPKEYLIVYKEIQKYLMKVDPINLSEDFTPLNELLDLFEESANKEKDVLQVTGEDVGAFADSLIPDFNTFSDLLQQQMDTQVSKKMDKWLDKI